MSEAKKGLPHPSLTLGTKATPKIPGSDLEFQGAM